MNKSTVDALDILLNIAGRITSVGCRELAREMRMDHSRMSRFLKSLCEAGFVEQDSKRKYHGGPGLQVLTIKNMHSSKLLRATLPVLSKFEPFKCIVAAGVLFRREVCYCFHAAPGDTFAGAIAKLNMFPAEWSSIGLALMARRSDKELLELYSDCSEIEMWGNIDGLLAKIQQVREEGHALMPCWRKKGLYTIATCVGDPAFGAIAFSDFKQNQIKHYTDKLSQAISGVNEIIRTKMEKEFSYKQYL